MIQIYSIERHTSELRFIVITRDKKHASIFPIFTRQRWLVNPGIFYIKDLEQGDWNRLPRGEFIKKYIKNGYHRGTLLRMKFKNENELVTLFGDLSSDLPTAQMQILLNCLIP